MSGGSGPTSSRRFGVASRRAGPPSEGPKKHPITQSRWGCSARSPADTDFPGSAGTSERQGVSGSLSGRGKSVSAPRTLTRGSRGHLRVGHVRTARRAPCGTRREKRRVRPLAWDGLAGAARKGFAPPTVPGLRPRSKHRRGSESRRLCSGIHTAAEIDERHVARRLPVNNRSSVRT